MRFLAIAGALAAAAAHGPLEAMLGNWSAVDQVLTNAIAAQVFPGCAAGVIDAHGNLVYARTFGNFTYGNPNPPLSPSENPPVTPSTLFDMASVTKILGATTISALLYQRGLLDVDMLVSDPSLLGPAYAGQGKGVIRVADCLMHQAGYPPDPSPDYNDPAFGCPATSLPHPPLTFNCSEKIYASLLAQTLQYPPTTQWVYSDLSMITMQYVLGTIIAANGLVDPADLRPDCSGADPVAQPGLYKTCHFEAFARVHVHAPIGMAATQFLIPPSEYANAMPTWVEAGYYRNQQIQGTVSDDNSYALGGIAGHAGVFSNLNDMLTFTAMWAGYGYDQQAGDDHDNKDDEGARGHRHHHRHGHGHGHRRRHRHRHGHGQPEKWGSHARRHRAFHAARDAAVDPRVATSSSSWPTLINATTRDFFFTAPRPTFSPRGLGWVVQTVADTYLGCGNFSALTAYHTGYTGTLLCVDPVSNVSTVLLTNRVYPNSTGNMDTIHTTRQLFNNAVLGALQARDAAREAWRATAHAEGHHANHRFRHAHRHEEAQAAEAARLDEEQQPEARPEEDEQAEEGRPLHGGHHGWRRRRHHA